jgi:putative ABC transport system permease protein
MKWLPLLWAGLWRKRARTIFTLISIVIAFLLVGAMSGIAASFHLVLDQARLDRVVVTDRFGGSMPIAYLERVARVPGVTRITAFNGLPGFYRDSQTGRFFIQMVDENYLSVYPETPIMPEQFARLRQTPTGIIINQLLANRFDWKVGDRVPMQSVTPNKDSKSWTFDILAVVPPNPNDPGFEQAWGNLSYMDAARGDENGRVVAILLLTADVARASQTANAIEALFENSSVPVNAVQEQLNVANQLQGFLNMDFVTRAVSAAALFMILFLTTNVMVQSVRERIPEFAVLKSLGMSDRGVLTLVLTEALFPYLIGAALGLALSYAVAPIARQAFPRLGIFTPLITPTVIVSGLLLAVITAVLGALPAAWRVKRLPIADALVVR